MNSIEQLTINIAPVSQRPFRGLGVEADAYIFDETNRNSGVTDRDLELVGRRLRALRPAIARMFVEVPWFNPSLDGVTFTWDSAGYRNLVRQLRSLQETGTRVNLVLFQPLPSLDQSMDPAVRSMLTLVERLIAVEEFDHLRWLTLWNEPDSLFQHDSDLHRRVFEKHGREKRPPWPEYVRLNQLAYQELIARKLYPQLRLVVADTVWGAPMRLERMRLSCEAFGDLDVDYSYHNYSTEDLSHYKDKPDFAYAGMAAEAAAFRDLLGPQRELVLWEFNTAGLAGFGGLFPGAGPAGIEQIGSIEGAVDALAKVFLAAANGVDGFCLWCLHDMMYCGSPKGGPMRFGLWRFVWEKWLPRPIYHYYAALMTAFRPGTAIHTVTGARADLVALAGKRDGQTTVAILNTGVAPVRVGLPCLDQGAVRRVSPGILPPDADLPVTRDDTLTPVDGCLTCELAARELALIQSGTTQ
jgi:hypothetical protein